VAKQILLFLVASLKSEQVGYNFQKAEKPALASALFAKDHIVSVENPALASAFTTLDPRTTTHPIFA
jgi:hypothetical protein